jgi:two-component system OmpR family response regulator
MSVRLFSGPLPTQPDNDLNSDGAVQVTRARFSDQCQVQIIGSFTTVLRNVIMANTGPMSEGRVRILLVEDDNVLGAAVRDYMTSSGNAVDWMRCKADAEEVLATTSYGLVLLDLRLPDGTGIDLLKARRAAGDNTPIIILTAHDQITDRIAGLNSGADDYLVKPFNLGELTARISAVMRRYRGNATPVITFGSFRINTVDKQIFDDDREIELSAREWAVFDALAVRPGAIVSKARIEEALYAFGSEIESNTVEVYVSRLRKKLGSEHMQTVRGVGYKLVASR